MSSRRSSILLMAEIPNNHLGWCWNPINNGIAETHHLTVNNGSTWISQAMPKAVSRHLEATREVWIGCDCGKQSWSTNSIMLLLWYYVYIQLIKWLLLYIILLLRSIIYYYYHYYYYLPYIFPVQIYIYIWSYIHILSNPSCTVVSTYDSFPCQHRCMRTLGDLRCQTKCQMTLSFSAEWPRFWSYGHILKPKQSFCRWCIFMW